MFRKRIIVFKIDCTGLDADAALKFAEDLKSRTRKTGLAGWIDRLFNDYYYLPTYEGDSSDIKVLR